MDERHDERLPNAPQHLPGNARDELGRLFPGRGHQPRRGVRREPDVGIDERIEGPRAWVRASCQQAHCFPAQPGGRGAPSTMRSPGSVVASRRSTSPVPSVEPSSSTMTSRSTPRCVEAARTAASMPATSFRAGIRSVTLGRSAPPAFGARRSQVRFQATSAVTPPTAARTASPTRITGPSSGDRRRRRRGVAGRGVRSTTL